MIPGGKVMFRGNEVTQEGVIERVFDKRGKWEKAIRILLIIAVVTSLLSSTALAFADLNDIPGGDFSYFGGTGSYNEVITISEGQQVSEEEAAGQLSELDDWVAALLRPAVKFLINTSRAMITDTAKAELLSQSFEQLSAINGAYAMFSQIHKTVVIPMGNVVVAIMFVVALVKLFSNSSTSEAFIDTWKLMMTLIMFAAALIIINASWEIMVMLYDLVLKMIQGIYAISERTYAMDTANRISNVVNGIVSHTGSGATDPTTNIHSGGNMLAALLAALILFLAGLLCSIVANVMIIVRAIEIYLYACFSPLALGFIISEGGRQMTESFFKRYLAVLVAGAVQVILLLLMSLASHSFGLIPSGTASDFASQLGAMLLTTIPCIACVFLMTKSTQVAKDILGVN